MPQTNPFVVPPSKHLLAAYQYVDGALATCPGQDDVSDHLSTAQKSLTIWDAAHRLPDAVLMIVKSDDTVSLGTLNGGLIIEGQGKLNIGLLRATIRELAPVRMDKALSSSLETDDRFRRSFWAVMSRLHGATLKRVFQFDLAGTHGTIKADEGQFTFSGDFTTPQEFVGELRAACQIQDDVQYTLGAPEDASEGMTFDLSELMKQVAATDSADTYAFDTEGWPTACGDTSNFGIIQSLSGIAKALHARDAGKCDTSIKVLSLSGLPILSGEVTTDGVAVLKMH